MTLSKSKEEHEADIQLARRETIVRVVETLKQSLANGEYEVASASILDLCTETLSEPIREIRLKLIRKL